MAYGRISLEQALNSEERYELPKMIMDSKYYQSMMAEAKLMFMLFRDRMSASLYYARKGDLRFVDDEGDVFIYYAIDDLVEKLGWKRDKIMRLKKELVKYGLIDEVKQGAMKGNRIYIKNALADFQLLNMDFEEAQTLLKSYKGSEVGNSDLMKSEKSTSRSRENRPHEVAKTDTSNTKKSNTKKSDIKFSHSEEDEEKAPQNPEEKNNDSLSRKVDKATKYDRDYIWDLVHDQLLKEEFSLASADFAMLHFDDRYQYALENMKFARSSEMVAEYVFNGILAEMNQVMRKEQNKGVG